MVAYIKKMAVDKHQWMDETTFKDGVVLCQTIPGSTAMQTAAYVGLKTRGVSGSLVSFVGFGLPAFILMLILSALYATSHNMPKVVSLFSGLQVIVVAIVFQATLSFGKGMVKSYRDLFIPIISAALFWIGVSPFVVILGAAIAGMVFFKNSDVPTTINYVEKQNQLFKQISLAVPILSFFLVGLYFFNKDIFKLVLLMTKIDLFAFGGGFAALPLMHHEVVDVRGWMSSQTFMDGIALGQITPGPITMSTTFVGYLTYGFLGAVAATLAIFTPSFLMVIFITPFFDKLKGSPYFQGVTRAIYASFVGLLCFVTIKFAYAVPWTVAKVLLVSIAWGALFKKVDILYVVLIGALTSLFIF